MLGLGPVADFGWRKFQSLEIGYIFVGFADRMAAVAGKMTVADRIAVGMVTADRIAVGMMIADRIAELFVFACMTTNIVAV